MTNPWRQQQQALVVGGSPDMLSVQRRALVTIASNLDAQLDFVVSQDSEEAEDFARAMGRPYRDPQVERVQAPDFHSGINPSLIESPPNRFPLVAVGVKTADPDGEQFDQFDTYNEQLVVEFVCKAGPTTDPLDQEASELVDIRTHLTRDAIVRCISLDRDLSGLVLPIRRPPRIIISNIVARKDKNGAGPYWMIQGGRLEYQVSKHSI